jgi:protein-S-isoprenylcysteine O-methyltransferase Ste14
MSDDMQDRAGMSVPPPLLYAGALLVGLAINRRFPRPALPTSIARVVGIGCLVLQALLALPAILAMRRANTGVSPDTPSTALVDTGSFRYSRNPIYVAMTLLYVGITGLVNTLWPLLLLPFVLVMIRRQVVRREEPYLERTFGAEYLQYKGRVRRWL